jgi:hypothetical protein
LGKALVVNALIKICKLKALEALTPKLRSNGVSVGSVNANLWNEN